MKCNVIFGYFIILLLSLNAEAQSSRLMCFENLPTDRRLSHAILFFENNNYLDDEYIFSDNENRKLVIYFEAPNKIRIDNLSTSIAEDPNSVDIYTYHYSGHQSLVVDSVVYIRRNDTTYLGNHRSPIHPLQCKEIVASPGSDAALVNCANQAFYVLQPGDEILLSRYLDRLQIKDFTFILKDMLIDDYFKLYDINKIAPVTPADTVTRRRPIVR